MQPIGHILVAHYSMKNILSDILSAYPDHVYSGSLGPDWFYNLHGGLGGYSEVSDAMHRYGTSSFYRGMLDAARNMASDEQLGDDAYRCYEATRAFAHGFISHVAADCIFHPYVNRRANNPWTGDKHGVSAHAGIETIIDNTLWPRYGNFNIQVNCAQSSNHSLADYPVRQALIAGCSSTYSYENWLMELLQVSGNTDDEDHPINKAFRAVRKWTALTEGMQMASAYNINDIIQHLKDMSFEDVDEAMALNCEHGPWCQVSGNEILRYSAEQLFDIAVEAARSAILIGERYINGDISSFDCCGIPFLERDFNIDTGLPSEQNAIVDAESGANRFAVGTQLIAETFLRFRA